MFSGMEELIRKLKQHGIKFEELVALETFGRGGDWHTTSYADKVKSLEVWEIDEKWKNELQKNLPNAKIKIQDSVRIIYDNDNLEKFSFIVIDNPQMLYGPLQDDLEPAYCEHFEVLKNIDKILSSEGIVVFNVNLKPFDYDKWQSWKKRREIFYGNTDTSNLGLDFSLQFYKTFFENMNFQVPFHIYVRRITPNPIETLYYFAYHLRKKDS
jgi:hypothetical protein